MDSSGRPVSGPIYTDKKVQSLPSYFAPPLPLPLDEKRKTLKIVFFEIPLFWANIFFAFLALAGEVGVHTLLPLWVDSSKGDRAGHSVDSYFVLFFSSLAVFIIFGIGTLLIRIFSPQDLSETEKRFPHLLIFLAGLCDALNGALVAFASKGSRTPPYLQATLKTFVIPLTILFRLVNVHFSLINCAKWKASHLHTFSGRHHATGRSWRTSGDCVRCHAILVLRSGLGQSRPEN